MFDRNKFSLTRKALVYVDYAYFDRGKSVKIPGEKGGLVETNFPITLWHEAILHGGLYIDNDEWDHDESVAYDPIHRLENQARKAWNINNSKNGKLKDRRHRRLGNRN